MIISYTLENKSYEFCKPPYIDTKNIYTVIVGKNGTGKSRLLNDIIQYFVPSNFFRGRTKKEKTVELLYTSSPKKIIAVSTSPYDKFPMLRSAWGESLQALPYSYVGVREVSSLDLSIGLMSKILRKLLQIRVERPEHFGKVIKVLAYLGYNEELTIMFSNVLNRSDLASFLSEERTEDEFRNFFLSRNSNRLSLAFFDKNNKLDTAKVERLYRIFIKYNFTEIHSNLIISIDSKKINSEIEKEDLFFLIDAGVYRLKDVGITKIGNKKVFRIIDLSSGEQCLFNSFLGIACEIADDSLILIDEPEISLHPEWQERYITLLMDTFQNYKNCHFIIATHSPQLVSKLSNENCYVLKMDNGELMDGEMIANNSVDFQLANVFSSPGFKNEYLARIAFSIISKVGKTNKFDQEDLENFATIQSQIKNMQEDDPIRKLFDLIKELKKNA